MTVPVWSFGLSGDTIVSALEMIHVNVLMIVPEIYSVWLSKCRFIVFADARHPESKVNR